MKSKLKSAFIKAAACAVVALSLGACDDLGLPHVFGGNEVPQDVIDQPRLVVAPTPEEEKDATWPRLGDVPSKPKNFSTQTAIEKRMFDLQEDRIEGDEEMKEYQELLPTLPPLLPPPMSQPIMAPPEAQPQIPGNFLEPPPAK